MTRKRLAILSTHPIQYHAHWFRALAAHLQIDLSVFYCYHASPGDQARAGFGVEFEWDVPLLEGYSYRFLDNRAAASSPHSFFGLDTPEIRDIIARQRFDAVLVNGWHYKSAWQAMLACWRTGTPVMLRGDSHLHSPRSFLKNLLKYPLYRAFIPRAGACLAAGKWSREYFLHYGARPERIFLVPHTVDEEWLTRQAEACLPRRRQLRQEWGLDEQATVLLFAGKFIEKKRPLDFLQALRLAAAGNGHLVGLMVGDGPLRPQCEAFARQHAVPVRFTGFLNQSQIVGAYVAADLLVLPSDGRETWGLVVNEAMACGLPCIVSDAVGCGPDLVANAETGAVFALGDVQGLAEWMLAYATDLPRLKAMGENARRTVASYSLAAAVEGVVKAVKTLAKGSNRPA